MSLNRQDIGLYCKTSIAANIFMVFRPLRFLLTALKLYFYEKYILRVIGQVFVHAFWVLTVLGGLGCSPVLEGDSGLGLRSDLELSLKDGPNEAGLSYSESDSPVVSFSLKGSSEEDILFHWELIQTSGGGVNNDFSAQTGQIILPKGTSAIDLSLPLLDDSVYEGLETYMLKVTSPNELLGVNVAAAESEIHLIDNDALPKVNFSATKSAFLEGNGTSTVAVTLDSSSEVPLIISYTLAGTAAGAGVDYLEASATAGQILFPAASVYQSLNFQIQGDTGSEDGNKTIEINLTGVADASNAGLAGDVSTHTISIIDTNGPLTVTIYEKIPGKKFYGSLPFIFIVLFNKDIDTAFHELLDTDFMFGGTATGVTATVVKGNGSDKDRKYELQIDSVATDGTVTPNLPAGIIKTFLDPKDNVAATGDAAPYDIDTPLDPSVWTLSSPGTGTISNDLSPMVSGSGIVSEEGSVASIYLENTCATAIGSASISGGTFTINNVTFLGTGVDDGVKGFYGKITDIADHTSNCIDLGLSYTLNSVDTLPTTPTNFAAASLDTQIALQWDGCSGCTYDLYWATSPGVTTADTAVLALTSPNHTLNSLTNGTPYYFIVRANLSGVGNGSFSAELTAMPYSNICDAGDFQSNCTINTVLPLPDNDKLSAIGDITVASGGNLQSNTGQSISLAATGSVVVETGGLITANLASLVAGALDIQTGSTFTGDVTSLSVSTMTVSGTMNTNIIDSNIDDLTVNVGGVISADVRGDAADTGLGAPTAYNVGGGGGGNGGAGGRSSGGTNNGGVAHGLAQAPVTLGSGGGSSTTNGGGRLKLFIKGTVTNNGIISAKGGYSGAGAAGGGAGGSIWIDTGITKTGGAGTLTGMGSISAVGGSGRISGSNTAGGGGGGGRVALHAKNFNYRGSVDVTGGNGASVNSYPGQRGSYDLQVGNVDSLCDTGTMGGNDCLLSSNLYLGNNYILAGSNYSIDGSGSLIGNFAIDLTGDLNLSSGAFIKSDGLGLGYGPGSPAVQNSGGGGGGHGGSGGRSNGAANGGASYGSITMPVTFGSCGGAGEGPRGGGALKITVQGTFTNDGTVSALANNATTSYAAGGAGGSIWIDVGVTNSGGAGLINGNGVFSVKGGVGRDSSTLDGGGGGGGRIAFYSTNYKFTGTVDISGGYSGGGVAVNGGSGSFYQEITEMDSFCDSGSMLGSDCVLNSVRRIGDDLTITGTSLTVDTAGVINGNVVLDLVGDLTLNTGASIDANGLGHSPNSGVGLPDGSALSGGGGGAHAGIGGRSHGAANGG